MLYHLFMICALNVSVKALAQEDPEKEVEAVVMSVSPSTRGSAKPIESGFFDRTLRHDKRNRWELQDAVKEHVKLRQEIYELLLYQINGEYFRRAFLKKHGMEEKVVFLRNFFEDKRERLEKKSAQFSSFLEVSESNGGSKDPTLSGFISIYNGQLNGDQNAQAQYAYEKYQKYLFIYNLVQLFPPSKAPRSPILQLAVTSEMEMRMGKIKEVLKSLSDNSGKSIVLAAVEKAMGSFPEKSLSDLVSDDHSIENYCRGRLDKWRPRMGEEHKGKVVDMLFKSFVADAAKGEKPEREEVKEPVPTSPSATGELAHHANKDAPSNS